MKLKPWAHIDDVHCQPGVNAPLAEDEFALPWRDNGEHIVFHCRSTTITKPRMCAIRIIRGQSVDTPLRQWGWDGNRQAPTITPSIGCDQRCGWHGQIVAGEITP